jgi:hypothetical protein
MSMVNLIRKFSSHPGVVAHVRLKEAQNGCGGQLKHQHRVYLWKSGPVEEGPQQGLGTALIGLGVKGCALCPSRSP